MIRRRTVSAFLRETRGAAGVEIAIWFAVLLLPIMSAFDIGLYVFQKMQVGIAAQQAAEAVRKACGFAAEPVTDTSQCSASTLSNALTAGRTGTSLGTNVTMASGYPTEGFYCVNGSGVLTSVGTVGTIGSPPTGKPADCSGVITNSTTLPVTYIRVRVTYSFNPLFGAVSLSSILANPIEQEAWLRLG